MKIIQRRKFFMAVSTMLVLASVVFLSIWGLKPGIDFTSGVLVKASFEGEVPTSDDIKKSLEEFELGSLTIQPSEDGLMFVRFVSDDDKKNEAVQTKIKESFEGVNIQGVEFTSSKISNELKSKAITAVIFAVVGIAIYIAWAFRRVSYPVESWKYGAAAVIALVHDTLITVGIFAFLGRFYEIEVGIPFVAALLTILGYSVNDTIVVFDRVRENLNKAGAKDDFEETVNSSINETLARSINTSLTVIVVLVAIILFGGATIKYFSLAMLIGVFFGTYSSIFVASAFLVEAWQRTKKAK